MKDFQYESYHCQNIRYYYIIENSIDKKKNVENVIK